MRSTLSSIPAAALAISLLLAGCLAPVGVDAPVPAAGAALPLTPLVFEGCTESLGIFPTPMLGLEDVLPGGFTPVPFDPAGAFATLAVVAYACGAVAGADFDGGDVRELAAFLIVEPPAEYAVENATFKGVLLGLLTTNADAQLAYEAWGVHATLGDVAFDEAATPAATVGHASGTANGFTARLTTTVGGSSPQEAGVLHVFVAEAGEVVAEYDFAWTASDGASGAAVLDLTPGIPPIPPPAAPGLGFRYAGADYAYTVTPSPAREPAKAQA